MGCKMTALKRTATDRIMTGIDMTFYSNIKRVCIVIFLTETCSQKVSHLITAY